MTTGCSSLSRNFFPFSADREEGAFDKFWVRDLRQTLEASLISLWIAFCSFCKRNGLQL